MNLRQRRRRLVQNFGSLVVQGRYISFVDLRPPMAVSLGEIGDRQTRVGMAHGRAQRQLHVDQDGHGQQFFAQACQRGRVRATRIRFAQDEPPARGDQGDHAYQRQKCLRHASMENTDPVSGQPDTQATDHPLDDD